MFFLCGGKRPGGEERSRGMPEEEWWRKARALYAVARNIRFVCSCLVRCDIFPEPARRCRGGQDRNSKAKRKVAVLNFRLEIRQQ